VQFLIERNVLQHFIKLLESPHIEVIEQVIWGIGNIAGDSPMTRDCVIASGALQRISLILEKASPNTSFLRNASWALSNLCRGRPQPDYARVKDAVPTLIKVLIENENPDIITDICWALSYLSDGAKENIHVMLNDDLVRKLIALMNHQNVAIAIPCLRTIGNIVTGGDDQTQKCVDFGLVGALSSLLSHPKKSVRKEGCWVLSNVTAGTEAQIQDCLDKGIVEKLVEILEHDDLTVKNEAIWALCNCTASASPAQYHQLVNKGILRALGKTLGQKDARMLAVALEGLENVLECGEKNFKNTDGEN